MKVSYLILDQKKQDQPKSNPNGKLADVIPLVTGKVSRTRRALYQYNMHRILGRK